MNWSGAERRKYIYNTNLLQLRKLTDQLTMQQTQVIADEKKLRWITEHLPVVVIQTDEAGRCVYINNKWIALTGLSLEQAKGDGWINAIHPDDRKIVMSEWVQHAVEYKCYKKRVRIINAAGSIVEAIMQAYSKDESINDNANNSIHLATITTLEEI